MCAHFQVFSRRPGHLRLIYTIVQVLSHGLLYVYFYLAIVRQWE